MVTLKIVEHQTTDHWDDNHVSEFFLVRFRLYTNLHIDNASRKIAKSLNNLHQIHTNKYTLLVFKTVRSEVWFENGLFSLLV